MQEKLNLPIKVGIPALIGSIAAAEYYFCTTTDKLPSKPGYMDAPLPISLAIGASLTILGYGAIKLAIKLNRSEPKELDSRS